ncbi:hypothetical protein B0H14DRAFT_2392800 [Mycena olivaceomarginata]|nr:hypothetical protein B0H14DRAFT_2392800 [Mycena olivaceomarginata]
MDVDSDSSPDHAIPTVELPPRFIFVKHHPHANKPSEIIPLDTDLASDAPKSTSNAVTPPTDRPWAPFRTYADFKFASRRVKRRAPNSEIDEDLLDLQDGSFSTDSLVSFRNHRDMERVLAAARTLTIDFEGDHFGGTYDVDVEFRDPWRIITHWVCDPTLAPVSTWFSQERYLCLHGKIQVDQSNALYDEPFTGETWRQVDDDLPGDGSYPACFLGLHVWLDKGLVSTKVKMHPILIRGCWIHSATRNGSGNGGSALVGFVKMVRDRIDPRTLKGSARSEYDLLKRMIYRGVCEIVMAPLQDRSHHGEALRFGDGVVRVAHPGVLIESMDFEELAAWLAIRNSRSLHPCPQCMVHHDHLHCLSRSYPARTAESMSAALLQAPTMSKTQRNEVLKSHGLHDFEHFLWSFAHSDPYKASGYDCLHFFDGGIWGRHMWVLLKEHLQRNGLATTFNENMNNFPHWRDLKHLSSPTTIDYSDGQTFLDILKCALPCLVQILPANSCLVKLVRAMQKVRILLGLEVMTTSRLELLQKMVVNYEKDVSQKHNKNLNFLKQHFLSHSINNFRAKGTSRNMNTRVGEGFQQEVAAQYRKTNGKNAEHQISIMDENEETMARIQMAVDGWLKSQQEEEKEQILGPSNTASSPHWKLGSADPRITTVCIEARNQSNPSFREFNLKLREYLARHHPSHFVRPDQDILIEPCKVLYVEYQSKVDWKLARDILRCNPNFHSRPRYDSIIYEAQDNDMAMGQLESMFRCHLPQKITLDLALIRPYRSSTWAPRTRTDCPVREWGTGSAFIALEHVTRGTLLSPIFRASRKVFYVVDCIDEDTFLRVNEID